MSALDDIGVTVENVPGLPGDGSYARALLAELEEMLQRLLASGEESSIDLGSLPLNDEDLALLHEVLGNGEVSAEVEATGMGEVLESGVPGIWWVTHFDEDGEQLAQFLEVTFCPEILSAPLEDIKEGLDSFRARLFELDRER